MGKRETSLGDTSASRHWRVLGPTTLKGVRDRREVRTEILVQHDGKSSCSADVQYIYKTAVRVDHSKMSSRPGVIGTYANHRISDTSCEIGVD